MAELNKYEELEKLAELFEKGILTKAEFEQRKAQILSGKSYVPQNKETHHQRRIEPQKRTKPFSEQVSPLVNWIKQNTKIVVGVGVSVLSLVVIYALFIRTSPEINGRKAAKGECNCKTESNQSLVSVYEDFLEKYDAAQSVT